MSKAASRQFTVAFEQPIDTALFVAVLQKLYGPVVIGEGLAVNGIYENWIIVENGRRDT